MSTLTSNPGPECRTRRHLSENHYCAGCMQTRPFMDQGAALQCPVCSKTLYRTA